MQCKKISDPIEIFQDLCNNPLQIPTHVRIELVLHLHLGGVSSHCQSHVDRQELHVHSIYLTAIQVP